MRKRRERTRGAGRAESGRVRRRPLRALAAWTKHNRGLAGVLLAACVLRVATIAWGVPLSPYSNYYHADEIKTWGSAARFPLDYLANGEYLYGTAMQYSVGLLMWPVKMAMWGHPDAYQIAVVICFRLVNVAMALASILLLHSLARRFLGERAAMLAAALLAVSPFHCLDSSLTTLDVPMSCLVLLSIWQGLRVVERPGTSGFVWLGVIAGWLLATKITAVIPLTLLLFWIFYRLSGGSGAADGAVLPARDRVRLLLTSVGVAVMVFALTTPHVFLSPDEYLTFMRRQQQLWVDTAATSVFGLGRAWIVGTATAVSVPVMILAVPGAFLPFRCERDVRWLLIAMVGCYYVFWRGYLPPRFVIVVAPIFCLFAAAFCSRLVAGSADWRRVAAASLAVVACAVSWITVLLGIAIRLADPRTEASRFIAREIPPGATIGVATDHNDPWQHHLWRYPRLDSRRNPTLPFLERPEYIVVTSYELDVMRWALDSPELLPGDRWDPDSKHPWYMGEPPSPQVFGFHRQLLRGNPYQLLRQFAPLAQWEVDGAAPTVFIYRRTSSPASAGRAEPKTAP